MRLFCALAAPLSLLCLSPRLTAQQQSLPPATTIPTSTVTVQPEFHRDLGVDVTPPPRSILNEPPMHNMPAVPQGQPSWDPPRGPETLPNVPAANPALATVQVYRNNVVEPAGASQSNVGEPSASKTLGGNTILHTGNWYAARSTDNGASWSYINPYTRFPAVDAGFCCDQFTILHAPQNMVVWLLQYSFSTTTNKGSIRLAVSVGNANTGNPSVSYVVDPSLFGFPAGTWFDFPHMAASNGYVFVASNVFNAAGSYVGSLAMRWNASQMATGATVNINYFRSDSATAANQRGSSFRFTEGYFGPATMWWASHVSTTSLRIYQWPDAAGLTVRDQTVGTWYSGRTDVTGPDGRGWLGRIDNRITGGFYTGSGNGEIGWMWTSNQGGTFPHMFVRMVKFDATTFELTTERSFWFSVGAWAYPAADASSSGQLAGAMCFGGGTFYPGTAGWIIDDLNCTGLDNIVFTDGNFGPDSSRFGDYVTSQYINGNLWMVTGIAQRDGSANGNSRPRNVEIGRTDLTFPTTYNLTVNSVPVTGAPISLTADFTCRVGTDTNFVRRYRAGTVVSATAPSSLAGLAFSRWFIDGTAQPLGQLTISVTMSAASTIAAHYGITGTFSFLGTGCLGSNGLRPTVGASGSPTIGQTVTYSVTNARAGAAAFMHIGLSNTSWLGIPLPVNLVILGAPNCQAYIDQVITLGTAANGSGAASLPFNIPFNLAFVGVPHYVQWTLIDPTANRLGLTTSNYVRTTPGSY